MSINKYGLNRHIPEEVKKLIRKKCGFGCVVCGSNLFEYEHVIPEFAEAKIHDPNKMALLCHQCHGRVTRRRLSKESILRAIENPKALSQGFANEWFDFDDKPLEIHLAGNIITGSPYPLIFKGIKVLTIKPPEEPGSPIRLSGTILNDFGRVAINIIDNEYFIWISNWDVTVIGPKLTIRNEKEIILEIVTDPPRKIMIKKLKMYASKCQIICDGNELRLIDENGNPTIFTDCQFTDNGISGIKFN